jgi:hypothetical protein
VDKLKYILFIFLLTVCRLSSQSVADTIKKIAIDCKDLTLPNDKLYSALKDFKCICIGELHGTKEPADFLVYLTRLFTDKKKKVLVGIEIPKEEMKEFIAKSDNNNLMRTAFFSIKGNDERHSEAWFNAISECNKLKVPFCFFDAYPDSLMCSNLIDCYKSDTSYIIITLTGNIHSGPEPFGDYKTMGYYLKEYFGNKLFSINHLFNEGTTYNSTDDLKIRKIPPINNAFATSTSYASYFILNIFDGPYNCSAFYYTKKVTASLPFKK